eukprot:CAMPEP_0204596460 /NCGR_PEP_ID=MMETSP0661-20131031/53252_1 /ASSEMBLY_ACC=CAM_ASM_000606 /TAXON_ID=109239 /ORGANISM="Alexandrium margalefi, Strain AMGDE01CS-322" /LENGTH=55 /DNA_ID=CAMNT_0051607069 /DNA_START=43 /DNA_END=206 /DNA_ORIENTATION=+
MSRMPVVAHVSALVTLQTNGASSGTYCQLPFPWHHARKVLKMLPNDWIRSVCEET